MHPNEKRAPSELGRVLADLRYELDRRQGEVEEALREVIAALRSNSSEIARVTNEAQQYLDGLRWCRRRITLALAAGAAETI